MRDRRWPDLHAGTETVSAPPVPTGPVTPQRGVVMPPHGLPHRPRTHRAAPWWVGAHGGAGESTLERLVAGSAAAEHAWPVPADPDLPHDAVLVVRTHLHGLMAAQAAARQWAAGDVPGVTLHGLVLLADAPGRLPRPLRELAELVGGGVPRVWSIPWVEAWRLGDELTPATAPRDVRRFTRELDSLVRDDAEHRRTGG